MLVLSRKKNEKIWINDDIEICIIEIRGDKVRIGVNAPKEVRVHRQEVYEAIQREGRKRLLEEAQPAAPPETTEQVA